MCGSELLREPWPGMYPCLGTPGPHFTKDQQTGMRVTVTSFISRSLSVVYSAAPFIMHFAHS